MSDFLNLRDRVLVVTGAASGMGRAIAGAAAREGARLVLSDFDGDRLKTTAAGLPGPVRHLRADVTQLPFEQRPALVRAGVWRSTPHP